MADNKFYEMTGLVHKVLDEQTFSSGFRKRDLILTNDVGDDAKYPKFIAFTFKKDRADTIKTLRKGQRVKVLFALDGHEYEGRYYPDITGIKAEVLSAGIASTEVPPPAEAAAEADDATQDDLPF